MCRPYSSKADYVSIRKSDIDHETMWEMDCLISQLSALIANEKMRAGSPTMISYHLQRALDYAERERNDASKRSRKAED